MSKKTETNEKSVFPYQTVKTYGQDEITEKKSRFIAQVMPVETEGEALQFIEEKKKEHWDARHNCYAFIIGKKGELLRFSDDGEPQGTAGKPILEVLQKMELTNVAVVVTRYFGGVLLGTGGLVRAYTQSTQAGLKAASVCVMTPMNKIRAAFDYSLFGKIKYILAQQNVEILKEDYGSDVTVTFAVACDEKDRLLKKLTDATNGRTIFEETEGEVLWRQREK